MAFCPSPARPRNSGVHPWPAAALDNLALASVCCYNGRVHKPCCHSVASRGADVNRILVVDDEPSICHLLRSVLIDEKYDVELASAVPDALEKLTIAGYDLAIVDLLLPGVDGLQLAEAIRALDPGTPVILMTAYGTPSFEAMASHPAVTHYVHKPFSLERLLSLVRRSMAQPEAQARL